jgi:hypothetical protein
VKLNIVPARTGIQWVKLGIQTFFKQPLALAGLFFMYMAVVLVLSHLPWLGAIIGGMLVPAATLGLMAATAEATKGRFPMPSVLLSAFRAGRAEARAMLILGVIYAAGSMAASLLAGVVDLGVAGPTAADPATTTAGPQLEGRALLALLLHTPLFILFWHAPALVHWHGVTPGKSLFFSAVACWRNFGALVLFVITWLGVFLTAAFVFGTVGLVLGGPAAARTVIMPTALLMAAMFSSSIYFTFRDSFVDTRIEELPPPASPTDGEQRP